MCQYIHYTPCMVVLQGWTKMFMYVTVSSHFCAAPDSGWPPPSTIILSQFAGRIALKWYEVGHALGVGTEVANLKQTEQNPERKCLLCLEAWINGGPEIDCSWEKLLLVLHSFQLHAVAKDIHNYLQKMATTNHSI